MPLLRKPIFDQGSESSGSVPNHLPLGESQPEDGMPLLHQPVFGQVSESSGSVPHHLPLGESQLEDVELRPEDEEDDDVTESYPVPTAPASVENGNDHAASGDLPSDPALGMDALNGAQSFPTNVAAQGIGENMLPVHPHPCWSAYNLFLWERISMFKNLPSQSMGQLIRLIEECWGRLTEAERGVYADQERMDRERYVRELNEYQERIRRTQSK